MALTHLAAESDGVVGDCGEDEDGESYYCF